MVVRLSVCVRVCVYKPSHHHQHPLPSLCAPPSRFFACVFARAFNRRLVGRNEGWGSGVHPSLERSRTHAAVAVCVCSLKVARGMFGGGEWVADFIEAMVLLCERFGVSRARARTRSFWGVSLRIVARILLMVHTIHKLYTCAFYVRVRRAFM